MLDLNSTFTSMLAQEIDLNNSQMSEKVIAALVGDPTLNKDEGIMINGKRSNRVYLDVADLDYKSMYPYIKIKNNIERVVQYFRVVIMKKVSDMENRRGQELYWRGGEFVEDYSTKNILTFCRKWFGLKSITEYIKEFKAELAGENNSSEMKFVLRNNMKLVTFTLREEFKTE